MFSRNGLGTRLGIYNFFVRFFFRLKSNITALNNSVLAKGEKVRDEEVGRLLYGQQISVNYVV
jgi:hypothetical protein